MQSELLNEKPSDMTTQHYQDLCQEVDQTITELNEDSKNLKVVHERLSEIEQAKDEISTWCIDVMNEEDQCGVDLKVSDPSLKEKHLAT